MLESNLVGLLEQFVLIAACSFPLYSPVINLVMSWQIYLESPLINQDCHRILYREQIV